MISIERIFYKDLIDSHRLKCVILMISQPEVIPQVERKKEASMCSMKGIHPEQSGSRGLCAHLSFKLLHGNQGWMAAVSLDTWTNRTCSLITYAHPSQQQQGREHGSAQDPSHTNNLYLFDFMLRLCSEIVCGRKKG